MSFIYTLFVHTNNFMAQDPQINPRKNPRDVIVVMQSSVQTFRE